MCMRSAQLESCIHSHGTVVLEILITVAVMTPETDSLVRSVIKDIFLLVVLVYSVPLVITHYSGPKLTDTPMAKILAKIRQTETLQEAIMV